MLVLFKYQTVENPKTGMSIRPASISTEPDQAKKQSLFLTRMSTPFSKFEILIYQKHLRIYFEFDTLFYYKIKDNIQLPTKNTNFY